MPRASARLLLFLLLCFTFSSAPLSLSAQDVVPADSSWATRWVQAGVDGEVNALLLRNDSLFVGGDYSLTFSDQLITDLAVLRISDTSWHDIGYRGGGFGEVLALTQSPDTDILYVGGAFDDFNDDTTIQNLVQWDGDNWSSLGDQPDSINGTVHAIYVQPGSYSAQPDDPDEIIIGGQFTRAGGERAEGIARYRDGFGWDDFGVSLARFSSNATVYAMSFHGGDLWLGGRFDLLAGDTVSNIATYRFFSDSWSAPDGGPTNGTVWSLDAFSRTSAYTKLVVGGSFTEINDSIEADNIALYRDDTETWTKIDSGLNGTVSAVRGEETVSGADIIVAGGSFDRSYADTTIKHFARWESATQSSWEAIEGGVDSDVNTFLDLAFDGTYIVGGRFRLTGDSTLVNNVARLGPAGNWHGYGLGPDGIMQDIFVDENGARYFAGSFTEILNRSYRGLAVWSDSIWRPAGNYTFTPDNVRVRGDTIYVEVNSFFDIDDVTYSYIAMWDGSQWLDMNGGLNGRVQAMAFAPDGGDLYVAGLFTEINGGDVSQGIARWDGSQWHNIPVADPGSPGYVTTWDMAFDSLSGDLYVVGSFESFDQKVTTHIARWDGSNWSAVGPQGVPTGSSSHNAYAVVVDGAGRVFVGGDYEDPGPSDGGEIWVWDGSTWSAAGDLLPCMETWQLISDGCNVYAAGSNYDDDDPTDCVGYGVLRFNGASWIELGSGVRGTVNGLALTEEGLAVAGSLSKVGPFDLDFGVWTDVPDSAGGFPLTILAPPAGDTLEYGTVYPIQFLADSVDRVQVEFSADSGQTWSIIHNQALPDRPLLWLVPDTNAQFCQLRIANGDFACTYSQSPVFTITADTALESDWLVRGSGQYYDEPFRQGYHNWSWENDSLACWPESHWQTLSYDTLPWPLKTLNDRSRFPDWWMFCDEWDACWLREKKPRVVDIAVFTFWDILSARGWDGSCYGFAVSDMLLWRYFEVTDEFILPDTGFIHNLPLDNFWREVVNKYWSYQFGPKHLVYGLNTFNITPMQTLRIFRDSAFASYQYPRVLSMLSLKLPEGPFNWNGVFDQQVYGHTIVPYHISNVPDSAGIYHIYVYDNNFPDDTTTYVRVDSINSSWSYEPPTSDSDLIFEDTCCGLYASLPIPEFDSPLAPLTLKHGGPAAQTTGGRQALDDYATVLVSAYEDVVITDSTGRRIGVEGTTFHNDSTVGYPIVPLQPGLGQPRPIGYHVPIGDYSVELSTLSDSVEFFWQDSARSYCLIRNSDSTETDRLQVGDGLSVISDDPAGKTATLIAIEATETDNRYYRLQNMPLDQGDSLHIEAQVEGQLFVDNNGEARTYEVILWTGDEDGQEFGQVLDITVDSGTAQWLRPDWNDLAASPIVVVNDRDGDGTADDSSFYNVVTDVADDTPEEQLPADFKLSQNYPNPFNPTTTIEFTLPARSSVTLEIYNVLGQRVKTLVNKDLAAGSYSVEWDGTNGGGGAVATGVYFYRLTTDEYTDSKKMLLLR